MMLGLGVKGELLHSEFEKVDIRRVFARLKKYKQFSFVGINNFNVVINELSGEWLFFDEETKTEYVLEAIKFLLATKPIVKRAQSYPSSAILNITGNCNFNCSYCFADDFVQKSEERFMDINLAKKVVREILISPYREIRIEFQGGEPLLNFKLIKELVRWVEKLPENINGDKSFHWGMETNGSLITKDIASFLRKHDFSVGISIDGPQKFNDLQRKTKDGQGSFKLVERGINYLIKAGYDNEKLGFVCIITSNNIKAAREIAEFFSSLKLSYKTVPFSPLGKAKINMASLSISNKEWFDFLINSYNFHYNNLKLKTDNRNQMVDVLIRNVIDFRREYICLRWPCGMAHEIISVNPSGGVYPCDGFKGVDKFKLGNLNYESLMDVIAKKDWYLLRRRTERTIIQCSRCPFRVFCGSCAYAVYGEKGTVYANDPYCVAKQSFFKFLILERIKQIGGKSATY